MENNIADADGVRQRYFASGFIGTFLLAAVSIMFVQGLHEPLPGDVFVTASGAEAPNATVQMTGRVYAAKEASWFQRLSHVDWANELAKATGDAIGLFRAHPLSPLRTEESQRMTRQRKAVAQRRIRHAIGARTATGGGPEAVSPIASVDVAQSLFTRPDPLGTAGSSAFPDIAPLPRPRPALSPIEVAAAKRHSTIVALGYAPQRGVLDEDLSAYSGLAHIFSNNPDDDSEGWKRWANGSLPTRGSKIAVYDISAKVVYMPDGTELEAHSGLGGFMDNPAHIKKRGRGPTPPNVYNLRMREARFHGVEAIRMLPVNEKIMHGRNGILAHSPLRRGSLGSAGCIAFQDYDVFLQAFKKGEVKQVVVVPHIRKLPTYLAML